MTRSHIFVVGGIVNGHMGGYVKWFDRYDPATGTWAELKNAKPARDHFQAVHLDGKVYAAGGRRTSHETKHLFDLTVPEVDVYDLKSKKKWSVLKENLPTPRAGNSTTAIGKDVVVAGGESMRKQAHDEVEAWDAEKECWHNYPSLNRGVMVRA